MGHSIRSKVKRKHKTIKALKQDPIKAKTLQKLAAIGDQVLKEAIERKKLEAAEMAKMAPAEDTEMEGETEPSDQSKGAIDKRIKERKMRHIRKFRNLL